MSGKREPLNLVWLSNIKGYCSICQNVKTVGVFGFDEFDVNFCADCLANAVRDVDPCYIMAPRAVSKISFDFNKMEWKGITLGDIKEWEKLYTDIDVDAEIQQYMIRDWLDKKVVSRNPLIVKDKLMLRKDWRKTIINWLKRSQAEAVGMR